MPLIGKRRKVKTFSEGMGITCGLRVNKERLSESRVNDIPMSVRGFSHPNSQRGLLDSGIEARVTYQTFSGIIIRELRKLNWCLFE